LFPDIVYILILLPSVPTILLAVACANDHIVIVGVITDPNVAVVPDIVAHTICLAAALLNTANLLVSTLQISTDVNVPDVVIAVCVAHTVIVVPDTVQILVSIHVELLFFLATTNLSVSISHILIDCNTFDIPVIFVGVPNVIDWFDKVPTTATT
jgi:hypothetical protein